MSQEKEEIDSPPDLDLGMGAWNQATRSWVDLEGHDVEQHFSTKGCADPCRESGIPCGDRSTVKYVAFEEREGSCSRVLLKANTQKDIFVHSLMRKYTTRDMYIIYLVT